MKYLVRSVKYFFYLMVILTLIILILVAAKFVEADISKMFVNGYDSLWQITAIMAVFAGLYPRFGYCSRNVLIPGETGDILPGIMETMENHGYREEKNDGDTVTFIKRSPVARAFKVWEDRLTFSRIATGYEVEGPSKDVVRIVSALDYRFTSPE